MGLGVWGGDTRGERGRGTVHKKLHPSGNGRKKNGKVDRRERRSGRRRVLLGGKGINAVCTAVERGKPGTIQQEKCNVVKEHYLRDEL